MVNLMSKRNYCFALSIIIILAGIVGFLVNGIELDIQFQGGTIMQIVMTDENFDVNKIEREVTELINKAVSAQKLKTYNPENNEDMIDILMLKVSSEDTLSDTEINNIVNMLKENYNVNENSQMDVQSVAPFIGAEMLRNGIKAAIIASILIILYVWWRFRVMGLAAAITSVLALVHDILVMFAVYTIFRIPVNESFIAAVLTILGYSLNDTIVIYDRIRENTKTMGSRDIENLVNTSVVQTLSRTIYTTISTLICVIVIYVFAAVNNIQSLKEFSFPLIFGLVSGTYSTVFIASPLWMLWRNARMKKVLRKKPSRA